MSGNNEIRIVRIKPDEDPEIIFIRPGLTSMQEQVGGLIERVRIGPKLDAWVNEEGLLLGLPYNRTLATPYGEMPLFGIIIVTGVVMGCDGEETGGLTPEEADYIVQVFTPEPEVHVTMPGGDA